MFGLCNARKLSYVSAFLQVGLNTFICFSLTVVVATRSAGGDVQGGFQSEVPFTTFVAVSYAVCLLNFGVLSVLIVGITTHNLILIEIYVYPYVVLSILYGFGIGASFILGFLNLLPIGVIFSQLASDVLVFGLAVLLMSPIIMHFVGVRLSSHGLSKIGLNQCLPNIV